MRRKKELTKYSESCEMFLVKKGIVLWSWPGSSKYHIFCFVVKGFVNMTFYPLRFSHVWTDMSFDAFTGKHYWIHISLSIRWLLLMKSMRGLSIPMFCWACLKMCKKQGQKLPMTALILKTRGQMIALCWIKIMKIRPLVFSSSAANSLH